MKDKNNEEYENYLVERFEKIFGEDIDSNSWIKGWESIGHFNLDNQNALTGTKYKGFNQFLLGASALENGFQDNRWASFETVKKIPREVKGSSTYKELEKIDGLEEKLEFLQEKLLDSKSKFETFDIYHTIAFLLSDTDKPNDLKAMSIDYLKNNSKDGFCSVKKGSKSTQIFLKMYQAVLDKDELKHELEKWDGIPPKPSKYKDISAQEYYDRLTNSLPCNTFHKKYNLFNVEQIDGLELRREDKQVKMDLSISQLEHINKDICDSIKLDYNIAGNKAYYDPSNDVITLPSTERFDSNYEFIATCLHEVAHATGHESRLKRSDNIKRFGDEEYAKEELVAEFATVLMTSSFLKEGYQMTEESKENHFKYLKAWSKYVKESPTTLQYCINQAFKVKEYVIEKSDAVKELTLNQKKEKEENDYAKNSNKSRD